LPYTIDFTASHYARRLVWSRIVLLLVLAALAGVGWGVGWTYRQWTQPTLSQQLSTYQKLAGTIEPLYRHWTACDDAFKTIAPYYRLFWAESVTDALTTLVEGQSRLPPALAPRHWRLTTGGEGVLTYTWRFVEDGTPKWEQCKRATDSLVTMLHAWAETVKVTCPEGDLMSVSECEIAARFKFSASEYQSPPSPPDKLRNLVDTVKNRREVVQGYTIEGKAPVGRTVRMTLEQARVAVSQVLPDGQRDTWQEQAARAIDPATVLHDMANAVHAAGVPVPTELTRAQDEWAAVASRRWPWRRIRHLDNTVLRVEIDALQTLIAGGLPPARLFEDLCARVCMLRKALLTGYSVREVFDEGLANRCLERVCNRLPPDTIRGAVHRGSVHDGLMLAEWDLILAPAGGSGGARSGRLTTRDVVASIGGIPSTHAGFVIETICLDFEDSPDRGVGVARASATGLLAVKASEPENKKQ
jgi:hypothetical protein